MYTSGTIVRVLPETGRGRAHRLAGQIGVILSPCKSVVPGWYKDIYRIDFGGKIDFVSHHSLEVVEDEVIEAARPEQGCVND